MRTIQKSDIKNEDFCASKQDCLHAFKELSNRGKQLYMYFITQNNYNQDFPDPLIIEKEVGLNHKYYKQTFNELINKGYLHRQEGARDNFIFSSQPIFPADGNI